MAQLVGMATEVPPVRVDSDQTTDLLTSLCPRTSAGQVRDLVADSRIRTRYAIAPLPELVKPATIQARIRKFARHATALGEKAARRAIGASGIQPSDICGVISVSSTTFMVPSLDGVLSKKLGLPPSCRRIPINELGCSGGVGAVGLAAEMVASDASRSILVVCAELASLWFPAGEPSISDLIASTLLGDGVAAAVIRGGSSGRGPEILATRSVLLPETSEGGGARLTDGGFRLVPALALPGLARRQLASIVGEFLGEHGLTRRDVSFWIANPRSPQILEAIGESLDLSQSTLGPSWSAWERSGNTISATIFFILEELCRLTPPSDGDLGLMLSFGAGVTCEMVLLRWHEMGGASA